MKLAKVVTFHDSKLFDTQKCPCRGFLSGTSSHLVNRREVDGGTFEKYGGQRTNLNVHKKNLKFEALSFIV